MTNKPTVIKYLPLHLLRFDPDNPRLPSTIIGNDEQAVLAFLLKDATLIELMGSIGEQDFFSGEPLLVSPNPLGDGSFLVVEGNRRFASVKLLNAPDLAPTNKISVQRASDEAKYKPAELPAVVFPTRESILGYLSYRHITGIKAWNPLQKARYLAQFRDSVLKLNHDLSIDQQMRTLAKSIGTKSDYVARLLTGYAVYEEVVRNGYFNIPRLSEDTFEFSVLTTAFTYSNIKKFIGLDSNDDPSIPTIKKRELQELIVWMFEKNDQNKTRLGESRNLKYLSSVVDNDKALETFRAGMPLIDAKDLTEAPTEIFRLALSQARDRLVIARDTLHLVAKPANHDEESLREILLIARDMRAAVNAKLSEEDLTL